MAQFTDRHGNDWRVDIIHGDIETLRKAHGICPRIDDAQFDRTLQVVFGDLDRFGALLYSLCREQIEERGLSPESFARCFTAETFDVAAEAVLEAFADFSQRSRGARQALRRKLKGMLADLDREMEMRTEQRLSTSSGSAGSAAALSASTPVPSPYVN